MHAQRLIGKALVSIVYFSIHGHRFVRKAGGINPCADLRIAIHSHRHFRILESGAVQIGNAGKGMRFVMSGIPHGLYLNRHHRDTGQHHLGT